MLNNAAIIFRSMMQKSQSLSTTEAEYIALCAASQDACYLLQMLSKLGMGDNAPITILEDNQAAITNVVNDVASPKLKHAADILTKSTDNLTFIRHRSTLMGMSYRP